MHLDKRDRSRELRMIAIPLFLALLIGFTGRLFAATSETWGRQIDDWFSLFTALSMSIVFGYVALYLCRFRATRAVFLLAIVFFLTTTVSHLLTNYEFTSTWPILGDDWRNIRTAFLSGTDFLSVAFTFLGFIFTIWELAIALDIITVRENELASTHASLSEQEEHYRTLVEDASETIYRLDLSGHFMYASPSSYVQMGYTKEETIGKSCLEFAHPDDAEMLRERTQRMIDELDDTPVRIEFRALKKSGEIVWVRQTMRLIIRDGEPQHFHIVALDVTEQKEADAKIRESQAQLRQILDQVPAMFWTTDSDLIVQSSIGPGMEQLGEQEGSQKGTPLRVILERLSSDIETGMERHRQALDGETVNYEVEVGPRTLHATLRPLIDERGAICGVIGVALDVTESQIQERALAESQERYRLIVEATHMIPWEYDLPREAFTYVGPQAVMTGHSIDEWKEENFWRSHIHPDDRNDVFNYCHARMKEVDEYQFEYRFVAKGGEMIWFKDIVSVIRKDGEPCILRGVFIDITEQKIAEAALAFNEERYRQLYEATPIMMFSCARDGSLINVNDFWLETLGYGRDDVIGEPVWNYVDKNSFADSRAMWDECWDEGEIRDIPHTFLKRDGTPVEVLLSATITVDESGEETSLAYAVDVTERSVAEREKKHLEERLQHTQKLESLGVLAGGIAHDFNNLLMGVLGNASLALMDLPEDSPLRHPLSDIEVAARRAAALCGQMLAYSGRGTFVTKPVNLNDTISEVHNLLAASLSKRVDIVEELDSDLLLVEGDEGQLNQVCMNLIINGAEAIGDGSGRVSVRTEQRNLNAGDFQPFYFFDEEMHEGVYVVLTVSDDGCGMPEDVVARLFEPFYTTKFTGRGLGMAVVLGIVRSHRGAIRVESEVGKGSTFTVAFPACPDRAPTVAEAHSGNGSSSWTHEGGALIVDDEETVCVVARRSLERCGMTVYEAADGQEGLELFREHGDGIDVVILDLTMPVLSGAEVYKRIRETGSEIPILLSSGYTSQDAMELLDEGDGRTMFLQKPYAMKELLDCVRALIEDDASARSSLP